MTGLEGAGFTRPRSSLRMGHDMNETRAWRAVAAGVGAAIVVAGCHPNSGAPVNAPPTATVSQPANGYPASYPPPPGYPGTYYSSAPPGYPQQPAVAAPAPGTYPAPAPYATQPPPGGAAAPPAQAPGSWSQGPPPGAPPGYPPAQAPPPTASSAPPAAPLAPTDPNSLQSILAGIQGALQGILVAPGSLPADITEAGLKAQALRLAPGMQPEGPELKQTLAEGQHVMMMVTLQAGKCYTLLGFSPPGAVKDLDLNLLAPPFYATLAGQDLSHDNAPSIGATPGPMCPIIAWLQYKLDVFAKNGGGPVAVQLYSKAKQ
jgi:hypothetical protein